MKGLKYIYVLVAGILMAACQEKDDFGFVTRPAEVGEEILFGARAGFENANPSSTRTEYGDTYKDPETELEYDPIKWVDGVDRIEIYSPQASNGPTSQYLIQDASDGDEDHKDEATLQRIGESSLQWGPQDMHTFYAMYPASSMFEAANTYAENINMQGAVVNGYVHTEQLATITTSTDEKGVMHYTAAPDMRFAYMVAKTSTSRNEAIKEDGNGNVKGVELTFHPIVTAVEFTLRLPTEEDEGTDGTIIQPLTITRVKVAGEGVAGTFTADLSSDSWTGDDVLPSEYIKDGSSAYDEITIDTWYRASEGEALQPVLLRTGGTIRFTVFVRPSAKIENLTVSYSSDGLTYVNKKLSGLNVEARKKNVIGALRLPVGINAAGLNYSKWMDYLNNVDDIEMKELSLPGTGGSFSYDYNSGDAKYFKSQTLTFDQQWEAGIRAFEISVDRKSQETSGRGDNQTITPEFHDEEVLVNGTAIGMQVNDVVGLLLNKLDAYPTETAMLIITYQPTGAQNYPRNPGTFMRNLMAYFNSTDYFPDATLAKLIRFAPDLTMKDAKGKLMVVVRPTNDDEDDDIQDENDTDVWDAVESNMTGRAADKILVVNGAGTGKDKWGSRGYTIQTSADEEPKVAYNVSNGKVASAYWIEQYMEGDEAPIFETYSESEADNKYEFTTADNEVTTVYRAPKGDVSALNFAYPTNTDMRCWYQEWARVVPEPIFKAAGQQYQWDGYGLYHNVYWFDSYDEKLSNAETTFKMAISGSYPSYVFINSLCGYLADGTMTNEEDIIPSEGPFEDEGENGTGAWGGSGGNVEGLATRINKDFYEFVLETPLTGPTGVVMMDYVLGESSFQKDEDGVLVIPEDSRGAFYLPRVIIANNAFRSNVGDDPDNPPIIPNPDDGTGGPEDAM